MCELTPEQEEEFNSGKRYLTREFVCKNCGLTGRVEMWINKKTIYVQTATQRNLFSEQLTWEVWDA